MDNTRFPLVLRQKSEVYRLGESVSIGVAVAAKFAINVGVLYREVRSALALCPTRKAIKNCRHDHKTCSNAEAMEPGNR